MTSEGNSLRYTFSGMRTQTWAVALRHKGSFTDLRGLAKLRWSTRTSGFDLMPGGGHGTQRGKQSPTAWSDVARIEVLCEGRRAR